MAELQFFHTAKKRSAQEREQVLESFDPAKAGDDFENYGFDYYDNPDVGCGYGGYHYDGRYQDSAQKFIEHYQLKPGSKVLEVGCAKGYVLVEFKKLGMATTGIEISQYAIENAHPDLKGDLLQGSAADLPFDDNSFDLVLCKEALPHLNTVDIESALKEFNRVAKNNHVFLEIQCATCQEDAELCYKWDKTHQSIMSPAWWQAMFENTNYQGDHHFKELF